MDKLRNHKESTPKPYANDFHNSPLFRFNIYKERSIHVHKHSKRIFVKRKELFV